MIIATLYLLYIASVPVIIREYLKNFDLFCDCEKGEVGQKVREKAALSSWLARGRGLY